jgi:hypothetical protein
MTRNWYFYLSAITALVIGMFVSVAAYAQEVAGQVSEGAVALIFEIIGNLIKSGATSTTIGLALSQIIIIIIKEGWLDGLKGKWSGAIKFGLISITSISVPFLTILIGNPELKLSQIISDSSVLAAVQLVAYQVIVHFFGKKREQKTQLS